MTEGMYVRHYAVLGGDLAPIGMVVPAAIAMALFGSLLRTDRRWWPWVLVPAALWPGSGACLTHPSARAFRTRGSHS